MKTRLWQIIVILLLIVRCNGDDQLEEQPENEEPEITEIGFPIGASVTADIGPSGGFLTSEDEQLTLTVPAGAVSNNTTFSIEPVMDFCPGGMSSYRLLPEGLTFTKPVTITFHYTEEDLEGTLSEFLKIAYQGEDQAWYGLSWATVDEQAKTISAPVIHFTNWSFASKIRIEPRHPAIPVVDKGSTYNLNLAGAKNEKVQDVPSDDPGGDDLPHLPIRKNILLEATWYVNGVPNGNENVGTISMVDKTHVTYHAPQEVPVNNPVLISAESKNVEVWNKVEGKVIKLDKVIVFKRIKIKPDEYNFTLQIKMDMNNPCGLPGQPYHDEVNLDVKVKNEDGKEVVTFSNIVNQEAALSPFELQQGQCTFLCYTGGNGIINVTKGMGIALFDIDQLVLDVENVGSTAPASQLKCPTNPGIVPTITPYGHIYHFVFKLSLESDQVQSDGPFWAKLSPD